MTRDVSHSRLHETRIFEFDTKPTGRGGQQPGADDPTQQDVSLATGAGRGGRGREDRDGRRLRGRESAEGRREDVETWSRAEKV